MSTKWYIVQAYSNCEYSVEKSIYQRAERAEMSDLIKDIIVPSKKVQEIKKGKKIQVEKKLFPGYVMVNMDLTNELWHLIKSIPKVSGFISQSGKPIPLKEKEAEDIIGRLEDESFDMVDNTEYEVGENVKIIDGGAFNNFTGIIESCDSDKRTLVVSVSIFGRETPVNLTYDQVDREIG